MRITAQVTSVRRFLGRGLLAALALPVGACSTGAASDVPAPVATQTPMIVVSPAPVTSAAVNNMNPRTSATVTRKYVGHGRCYRKHRHHRCHHRQGFKQHAGKPWYHGCHHKHHRGNHYHRHHKKHQHKTGEHQEQLFLADDAGSLSKSAGRNDYERHNFGDGTHNGDQHHHHHGGDVQGREHGNHEHRHVNRDGQASSSTATS